MVATFPDRASRFVTSPDGTPIADLAADDLEGLLTRFMTEAPG